MTEDEATIGLALHARLLAGDPLASTDIFQRYMDRLCRELGSGFPTTDRELIHDAVIDALFNYSERPAQYDPNRRKSLLGYLRMAARGDLLNLRARHRSRLENETSLEPVEIEAVAGKSVLTAGADLGDEIADADAAAHLIAWAMAVTTTEEERIVMRLILDGERSTEVFAQALGLDTLLPAAQQQRVFAVKDRLTKRLRRAKGAADG